MEVLQHGEHLLGRRGRVPLVVVAVAGLAGLRGVHEGVVEHALAAAGVGDPEDVFDGVAEALEAGEGGGRVVDGAEGGVGEDGVHGDEPAVDGAAGADDGGGVGGEGFEEAGLEGGLTLVRGRKGRGSYVCAVCNDDQVGLHLFAVEESHNALFAIYRCGLDA